MEHTPRSEFFPELRIFWIVVGLRFFFGIEMIQVAEKFVEAVHGWQMLIAIPQVVFAELAAGVAALLEQIGDRRRPIRDAVLGARHADGQEPGAKRVLSKNERSPAGGAALLRVGVGEQRTFRRDAIYVGRAVSHDAMVVRADVVHANIVAPNNQAVRFSLFFLCHLSSGFVLARPLTAARLANTIFTQEPRSFPAPSLPGFETTTPPGSVDSRGGGRIGLSAVLRLLICPRRIQTRMPG